MAYCRWSCDDFQCDLYVYEGTDGWNVHVAKFRYVFTKPLPPPLPASDVNDPTWVDAFMARYAALQDVLATATSERIELPHAGEHFCLDSAEDAAATIEQLVTLGYRVPDHVVPALRDEATT